ncbi:MAG: hypothetical protein ABI461_03755 [Polyangiaceae bacterium]
MVSDGGSSDAHVVHDAGPLDDSGPTTCYDFATAVGTSATGTPKAGQNLCTTTEVTDYLTACTGTTATAATCKTYSEAHPGCSTCMDGSTPTATGDGGTDGGADAGAVTNPYPVLIPVDSTSAVADLGACFAALSTGTADCKSAFAGYDGCVSSACSSCADQATTTACQTEADADSSGCSSIFVVDATCQTAITAAEGDATIKTKCGASATTFQDQVVAVAAVLCGAP